MVREAAAHHAVELSQTRRNRRSRNAIAYRRMGQQGFGAGINDKTVAGDAVRVSPPQVSGTPQLMDFNAPLGSSTVKSRLKLDDPVHQRMLGGNGSMACEQEYGTVGDRRLGLQFVNKFLVLAAGTCGL